MSARVLIVTGGLVTGLERSPLTLARKWLAQWREAKAPWLDLKLKLAAAEPVLRTRLARRSARLDANARRAVERVLDAPTVADVPPLTEVVLATALDDAGMPHAVLSLDSLFGNPATAARALDSASCVFVSTSFLHDLSEVVPIVERLRGPGRRIVLGGALASLLGERWPGLPGVDVLAVGYGELLVPALVDWIRSDHTKLSAPPGGRLLEKNGALLLFSGVPADRDLDFLPTPRWELAARGRSAPLDTIYYESVRGCPYSCSFCNYPNLFDDTRFRFKSAEKMADDWTRYRDELGVETIICLDSLFTMPRRRLRRFCELLIQRRLGLRWVCYARADDLAEPEIAPMMAEAGARQVQIGIESGDPQILANMNKACSVEANAQALAHCHAHGIVSAISLIVGFPGETERSLERTFAFMQSAQPDFYLLAAFSVRAPGVPVLEPASRQRFGLVVAPALWSMAPYWTHATMSCVEAAAQLRALDARLMREAVSLNAMAFFRGMLEYHRSDRPTLLALQQRAMEGQPLLRAGFDLAHRWLDRRLARDLPAALAPAS